MKSYITSVTLEINGAKLEDFNSFTEKERIFKKPVNLMNSTGTLKVKERHNFSLDYVVPSESTEFDFQGVEEGTVTIDYENGKRISFGEVNCLSIGEAKFDGDKETIKSIDFVAGTRTEQ